MTGVGVSVVFGGDGYGRPTDMTIHPSSLADHLRNMKGLNESAQPAANSGCLYIATGTAGTRVTWGSGPTEERATERCRSGGFVCRQPIGGCVLSAMRPGVLWVGATLRRIAWMFWADSGGGNLVMTGGRYDGTEAIAAAGGGATYLGWAGCGGEYVGRD